MKLQEIIAELRKHTDQELMNDFSGFIGDRTIGFSSEKIEKQINKITDKLSKDLPKDKQKMLSELEDLFYEQLNYMSDKLYTRGLLDGIQLIKGFNER